MNAWLTALLSGNGASVWVWWDRRLGQCLAALAAQERAGARPGIWRCSTAIAAAAGVVPPRREPGA